MTCSAEIASLADRTRHAYRRREPEKTLLYRILQQHLETFLARTDERGGLPWFVRRELRSFLACGLLCYGFARVHCSSCGKDMLVGFSCRGRGFCPSCGARRMSDTAAHLVDHVLPHVPVRQWVLSLPYQIRFRLASRKALLCEVRRIVLRRILAFMRRLAKEHGYDRAQSGAVTSVQRFNSALGLDVHLHCLVLDGVFTQASTTARPVFHDTRAPTTLEVARLALSIRKQVLRLLHARGFSFDSSEPELDMSEDEDALLAACQAASVQGRIALGNDAGKPVVRIGRGPGGAKVRVAGERCADVEGFSLHCDVRVPGRERSRLERLARYVLRPALATERLTETGDGRVAYHFKNPWRDGSTHVVFTPQVFLERLAALIPPPRAHLVTYHGVLAPGAALRDLVVPAPPRRKNRSDNRPSQDDRLVQRLKVRNLPDYQRRYPWSELLLRVFLEDVLKCPCGARRKLIALITDPPVVTAILKSLGLATQPPAVCAARPPPALELQPTFEEETPPQDSSPN
ncbi:MAG: transposase [Planctomycetota bacterium]